MAKLSEHFARSGYTLHNGGLRISMLPKCCQGELSEIGRCVKYLNSQGEAVNLPIVKCNSCERLYIKNNGKYMLIDNLLKYELTDT